MKKARTPSPARNGRGCPIVGVGASAGGLEAFTLLLKQLPVDTGFGFVLVQHLDPQHESALTQLLARATAMPVREVTNNLRVQANHVYIIPPNTSMGIAQGLLKLQPRTRNGTAARSIDFFFEALAHDQQERAVGVILSGNASDGTIGLEAIKAEGGLTFAQDDSSRYDSMPRSAVAAGCVDFVLPPQYIARELARIAKHPYVAAKSKGRGQAAGVPRAAAGPAETDGYKAILLLLRNHSGVDFSLYKPTTIHRRITRRAVLNHRDTLESYADFLRGNAKELDALYSDALISVTSFFRNADAFGVLKSKVLARLIQQRGDDPLRVWVLGCSTGQEAYSIAMLFTEAAEKSHRPRALQVFATDLSEANLAKARHGLYPKSVTADISPERLRRFFVQEEGGYRVIKALRESVVFARHNLISDPPFSRMDLITCRNVMIYLEPSLQKKVLPAFHYALKPEGYLFLGASESIAGHTDLFALLDKKQKIFAKKAAPARLFQLPVRGASEGPARPAEPRPPALAKRDRAPEAFPGELNAEREADRVTLNQFAPPSVLINADLEILQFRGATGAFLEPPTGKARFDLLKMAREGLMLPLRATVNRAKRENKIVRTENVPVGSNGRTRLVNVEVVPLKNLPVRCFLVLFEDAEKPGSGAPPPPPRPVSRKEEAGRIAGLERDLTEARDYLQSVQEHQEAVNEELQASNEESQSANEELQSLNEELETSKEELESTNEELTTVNEEMVSRNTELNRLNSDLTNLQTSAKLVVVLLGRDLAIRRFSPQAEKQFNLGAADVGRPLGHVRHNLDLPDLDALVTEVITSVRECEREVRSRDGRWYSLRVRPYLTHDNKVDGAVLVLLDITVLKDSELEIGRARDFAEAIIDTVRDPFLILDSGLRVQKANEAFFTTFGLVPAKVLGRPLFDLDQGQWDNPKLRKLLQEVLPRRSSFNDFEVTQHFKNRGTRTLLLNARALSQSSGHREKILLGLQDVTVLLHVQAQMRASELRYRRLFEAAKDGILILDPRTRKITEANPFIVKVLGYTREQLIGKELWQIGLLKDERASQEAFRELKKKGFIRYEDLPLETRGGQRREVEFVSNLYDEGGEAVIQCNIRDITERQQAEAALRASEDRYRVLFDLRPVGVYSCDATGALLAFNRCAEELWGRKPKLGRASEKFCGSHRLYRPDGTPLPHGQCPMAAVLSGKIRAAHDAEVVIGRPNGSRLTVIVNIVPLKDEHGKITGAINCFYDITARKRAEEALHAARTQLAEHAGQLEKLVTRRTAQLTTTNRQLETSLVSIRQGHEMNHRLLVESQGMQKKLRKLTHQILTTQEEERKKISRELHDEVVQTLVGINVELSALVHGNSAGVQLLKDKIARTQRLVEKSVDAVHRFARELRPAVLDDLGLIPALHAFCQSLAERKKIKIKLTAFGGVEQMNGDKRTVLFRVAQEALTNVARHARATRVRLSISKVPGAIRLEIADNGMAFPVKKILSAKNNKRLGLVGMKERVEMVGGNFTIDSVSGKGTTVRAEIPFNPRKPKS